MSRNFWPQDEWDSGYSKQELVEADPQDLIRLWLEDCLPQASGACLEFGCYPGHYLGVLGRLGFELNGVDLTPQVEPELKDWLDAQGYRMGVIERGDFFTHEFERKYELVCSFGLIEHFSNWKEAVARHAELVAPGGYLVLTTPNFRGSIQHFLHRHLDRENLLRHNLDAMDPEGWAEVVREMGWEVIECGGLGRFDFWVETQSRNIWQRIAVKLVRKLRDVFVRVLPAGWRGTAPHFRLLARRPTN